MTLTILLFLGSAVVIYFSCELFVNGVEWLGCRLSVTQTATGTILARLRDGATGKRRHLRRRRLRP